MRAGHLVGVVIALMFLAYMISPLKGIITGNRFEVMRLELRINDGNYTVSQKLKCWRSEDLLMCR